MKGSEQEGILEVPWLLSGGQAGGEVRAVAQCNVDKARTGQRSGGKGESF